MIDEARTLELYGYTSDELKPHSNKPIIAVCDGCGRYRISKKQGYRLLCKSCAFKGVPKTEKHKESMRKPKTEKHKESMRNRIQSDKTKEKISKAHKGKKHSVEWVKACADGRRGKTISAEGRHNMSVGSTGKFHTEETKKKMSIASKGHKRLLGHRHSEETKKKMSAVQQGVSIEDWEGYVSFGKYCYKFNEECKQKNREKYDNLCFVCGKTKKENGNRALNVHHVARNKMEGCDGSKWNLIPVCSSCHRATHYEPMLSRLKYLTGGV